MSTLDRLRAALADRYRVDRELGAGGMATVYLAHDLRHERDVAIKVLHPDLGAALGADRFLAEIKTTAKLQHPHILPLLDSGEADGLLYYVMPLVRGETLRARLERERQLPIPDALRIAREVAAALDHAHKQGIIHRDIKPENILLQDGAAVVADFGIALAVQQAGGQRMTQTGLSLGTPQYMSPEQAMGERTIDARSDIYALGAVTYEMLTGEPPFAGASVQAIVARVLSEKPTSIITFRDIVSPTVERAVLSALAKLPADRPATAAMYASALEPSETPNGLATSAAASRTGGARTRGIPTWATALLAIAAAAAAWVGGTRRDGDAGTERATRFALHFEHGEHVASSTIGRSMVFEPDGGGLVYAGIDSTFASRLYRRDFDAVAGVPIDGTADAMDPTVSPDGKWIAFVSGGTIKKISATGGTPSALAQYPIRTVRGLAWVNDSTIIFGRLNERQLFSISPNGGTARPIFADTALRTARWPISAGDGDHVVFMDQSAAGGILKSVYLGSTKRGTASRLDLAVESISGANASTLFFVVTNGDLMRVGIDWERGTLVGQPTRIATNVGIYSAVGIADAAVSARGDAAIVEGVTSTRLSILDRTGRVLRTLTDSTPMLHPRISPDGRQVAFTSGPAAALNVRVWDVASGVVTTVGDERPGVRRNMRAWAPDGLHLIYAFDSGGVAELRRRPFDRRQAEQRMMLPVGAGNIDLARTGTYVIGNFTLKLDDLDRDLHWWTTTDTTPHRFTSGPATDYGAVFSPDGRWVAWSADEGGLREAFMTAFPGPGARLQLTQGGGRSVVWERGGTSLLMGNGDRLDRVTVTLGEQPRVGSTKTVLRGDYLLTESAVRPFDVGPNDEIAVVSPLERPRAIVMLGVGKRAEAKP